MNSSTAILGALFFDVAPKSTGVLFTNEAKPGWRKAAKRRVYRKLQARRRANRRAGR